MPALRRKYTVTALILAAALVIRAVSAGEYLPILDDSIQYINFPRSVDYLELIRSNGLFATRPLAILTDLFFVGRFGECLIVPVTVFSVMHGITAVLFWRVFRRRFGTGMMFPVIFALLPLTVEGTYWLSAASRIVPGLFFCAVAANLLDGYTEAGGKWRCVLFPVAALMSYGFYEQILVLSFILSLLQFATSAKNNRRAFAAVLALPMLSAYFIFTGLNSADGVFSGRMELVFPIGRWYFDSFLPNVLRQMGAVFIKGSMLTTFRGTLRGLMLCARMSYGNLLMLFSLLLAASVTSLAFYSRSAKPPRVLWLWGSVLMTVPLLPFFAIANPWFSIRGSVPCLVGAALMLDGGFRMILRRELVYAWFCAFFAAAFMIAGVSEVHDFKNIAQYDDVLAEAILEVSDEMEGRVGILCVEAYPIAEANYIYHEHIGSVGGAEWSLYGKLAAKTGGDLSFSPVPLGTMEFTFYNPTNRDIKRISGFDELWLLDDASGRLLPLEAVCREGEEYAIFFADGTPFGRIYEEDGWGYIEIY